MPAAGAPAHIRALFAVGACRSEGTRMLCAFGAGSRFRFLNLAWNAQRAKGLIHQLYHPSVTSRPAVRAQLDADQPVPAPFHRSNQVIPRVAREAGLQAIGTLVNPK